MKLTEYQRGYNAGLTAKNRPRVNQQAAIDEANRLVLQALVERAERAERGAGIGKCDGCLHWQRQDTCHWGACLLREDGTPVKGWPWRGEPDQEIFTQENFGCIRFQPIREQART